MTQLRSIPTLTALVRAQTDPADPLVRAALEHAVQIWHTRSPDSVRWGLFATAVQAVTAAQSHGPAALAVHTDNQDDDNDDAGDDQLRADTADLVEAVADIYTRASISARSWSLAAAAGQLRAAVEDLR